MLFNSYIFIFAFLPLTFFIYFLLNKFQSGLVSKYFLVFASLFFYGWWNVLYLPLILGSMIFNFFVGRRLSGNTQSGNKFTNRNLLLFGVTCNLGLLGYFKYADFFITNFNLLTDSGLAPLKLALPLAISFFTFQQIAYLVDSSRNETKEYDFANYALFVTFFPQLIAGPIVHHQEMMPQFSEEKKRRKSYANISLGLYIFSMGLFKKLLLADTFAVWANNGFDVAIQLNVLEAWVASLSYTLQLYFDFSGYTDMAIGAALLFNITLPVNFFSPYKAQSIQDFWRRWHMTLSRFLKDYLYIPLGGNRGGTARTYVNLFLTFLLGGLWHGAGWTFVAWGALHGVALITHRYWNSIGGKMKPLLAWFVTFHFVNIAWVFFRATSFADASKVLKAMFGYTDSPIAFNWMISDLPVALEQVQGDIYSLIAITSGLLVAFISKNSMELKDDFMPTVTGSFITTFFFVVSFFCLNKHSEFLYFQF